MSKITDMVVSALMKKGILYEARNAEIELELPREDEEGNSKEKIKIQLKIEHMTLRIEKE